MGVPKETWTPRSSGTQAWLAKRRPGRVARWLAPFVTLAVFLFAAKLWRSARYSPALDKSKTGQGGKYTIMTMTYAARASLVEDFVRHYSRCSLDSLDSILVVWNGDEDSLHASVDVDQILAASHVPVRFRLEKVPSMNNRYKVDELVRTDALLSMDDDLRLDCGSVERAFHTWQRAQDSVVGWFPRLVTADGSYLGEPETIQRGEYNMILSGAAIFDHKQYFPSYWAPELSEMRLMVDNLWNCDDILFNYVVASGGGVTIYDRAESLVDLSSTTGVGISHDEAAFISKAEQCISVFHKHFTWPLRPRKFDFSKKLAPVCDERVSKLFCVY